MPWQKFPNSQTESFNIHSIYLSIFLGVIRTREFLTATSPRSYMFPVQYNDCGSTGVNKATAIVNIRVVESNCQPKWNGKFYAAVIF